MVYEAARQIHQHILNDALARLIIHTYAYSRAQMSSRAQGTLHIYSRPLNCSEQSIHASVSLFLEIQESAAFQ